MKTHRNLCAVLTSLHRENTTVMILLSSIVAATAVIATVNMAVSLFGSRSKSHQVLMLNQDILDDDFVEEDADLLLVVVVVVVVVVAAAAAARAAAARAAAARAASRVKLQ
jgi:hypothetical protein